MPENVIVRHCAPTLAGLKKREAEMILQRFGYTDTDYRVCVRRLQKRLYADETFPHEIGLFLGYPPEDVQGFIDCRGRDCKLCGYWKVYGDVNSAKKLFERFSKCTGVYLRCLEGGIGLSKLAVNKKATA